jgi:hypothetical protein
MKIGDAQLLPNTSDLGLIPSLPDTVGQREADSFSASLADGTRRSVFSPGTLVADNSPVGRPQIVGPGQRLQNQFPNTIDPKFRQSDPRTMPVASLRDVADKGQAWVAAVAARGQGYGVAGDLLMRYLEGGGDIKLDWNRLVPDMRPRELQTFKALSDRAAGDAVQYLRSHPNAQSVTVATPWHASAADKKSKLWPAFGTYYVRGEATATRLPNGDISVTYSAKGYDRYAFQKPFGPTNMFLPGFSQKRLAELQLVRDPINPGFAMATPFDVTFESPKRTEVFLEE